MPTLQLNRRKFGLELRRGTFHALLDGNDVGSIELDQTIEVPIEAGRHTLQITAGRYTSRTRSFEASDGDSVKYRCHGTTIWPKYLASIAKRDLAIALLRE